MAVQLGSPMSVMHTSETPLAGNAEGFGYQNQSSLHPSMGHSSSLMGVGQQSPVEANQGIGSSVSYISGMQTRGAAFSHGAAEGHAPTGGGMQQQQNGGGGGFGGMLSKIFKPGGSEGEAGGMSEDAGGIGSEIADVGEVAAV